MALKLLKAKRRKIVAKNVSERAHTVASSGGRAASMRPPREITLVGTYKERQLAWIKKNGVYNYPAKDGDEFDAESFAKIKELWLYADSKGRRRCFTADFVGKMSREEFLSSYPTYADIGRAASMRPLQATNGRARAHMLARPAGSASPNVPFELRSTVHPREPYKAYYVFKTTFLDYGPKLDDPDVLIRAMDFATGRGRTKSVKKAFDQYKADGEFAPLAHYLPTELSQVPRERLRVCEAAVQMNFISIMFPPVIPAQGVSSFQLGHAIDSMTVIDLFAGCGGMSLGFELAGFRSALAVEKDAWASETYSYNHPYSKVITGDITKISQPRKQYDGEVPICGIIGGPPCQGFSLSGDRDPKDPRNSLFMDYMRFVRDFQPAFFVMENVPGILSSVTKVGVPVKDVVVSEAQRLGYNVKIMQLDAADYGVPQSRHRVFFVGIRNIYPFDPDRLTPVMVTHENRVTIREALSDLPVIRACEGYDSMPYAHAPENAYQHWCRAHSSVAENHIAMRHTKRLVARFHIIAYGESAADVPEEHKQRKRGNAAVISGKVYSQNNMRPFPDQPSPTVPASFQSNFVHPFYDRNYTAREGARLQSFPDSYVFKGKRTTMSWEKNLSQYQQIGNAVPPLLAKALGEMIKNYFGHTGE